jgi:hypothetical protein
LAFLTQNKAKLWRIFIITLVFEINANFRRKKLEFFSKTNVMMKFFIAKKL